MAASGSSTGTVKSYNGAKGYGFIKSDDVDKDIMFTRQALPADAANVNGTFLEGRQVAFIIEEKADGKYSANSVQIPAVEGQELMGAIKDFSDRNGYGFITSSAVDGQDIRFDARDLQYQMTREQIRGALVVFQLTVLPDQKLRANQVMFQSDGASAGKDGKGGGKKGAPPSAIVPVSAYPGGYGKGAPVVYPTPYGKGDYGKGDYGKGDYGKGDYGKGAAYASYPPAYPSYGKGQAHPYGKGKQVAVPQQPAKGGSIGHHMRGQIKSFSEWNGYGFINIPGTPGDIKFGTADLVGVETVAPGTQVTFMAVGAPDGRVQAKDITVEHFTPRPAQNGHSKGGYVPQRAPKPVAAEAADGEPATGIVKNFNAEKGFGFITVEGKAGDVYLGKGSLPEEFQQAELAGATVSFEIALSKDGSGKMRAQNVIIEALGQ